MHAEECCLDTDVNLGFAFLSLSLLLMSSAEHTHADFIQCAFFSMGNSLLSECLQTKTCQQENNGL